jgi:hypothetical protein
MVDMSEVRVQIRTDLGVWVRLLARRVWTDGAVKVMTMSSNAPVRYCRCGTRLARDNPDSLCALCQRG